jgi:hypothetical protein
LPFLQHSHVSASRVAGGVADLAALCGVGCGDLLPFLPFLPHSRASVVGELAVSAGFRVFVALVAILAGICVPIAGIDAERGGACGEDRSACGLKGPDRSLRFSWAVLLMNEERR